MATIYSSNFNLTSKWTVAYNGSYYYIGSNPSLDSHVAYFDFSSIPAGTVIESAVLYADLNSPSTGAALRTLDGASFSGSRDVTIVPGGTKGYTFRFRANGSASSPTGPKSSTLTLSNVRIVINEGQTGGGGDPGGGTYQSPQYVWFDKTTSAKPGEVRKLKWTAGTANVGNSVASYDIHRSTGGGAYSWLKNAGNALSTDVSASSVNGRIYRYKVLTVQTNADPQHYYLYSNATGILKTEWEAPSAPSSLISSVLSPSPGQSFTLSWAAGAHGTNNAMVGYDVQRSTSVSGPYASIGTPTSASILTTSHPSHNGSYFYRVITRGTYSDSSPSSVFEVKSISPFSKGSFDKSIVPMDGLSTIVLSIESYSPNYTHNVYWSVPGFVDTAESQDIDAGILTSEFIVPLEWCSHFPASTSGTATARLRTYDGSELLGEETYQFTVMVPLSVSPTLSVLVEPVDGFFGLYLNGRSKAKFTLTDSGSQGSTIQSRSITGGGFSGEESTYQTGILSPSIPIGSSSVDIPFTITVTDTRGRQAFQFATITVTDYSVPTIQSSTPYRSTIDGTRDYLGEYVRVLCTIGFKDVYVGGINQNSYTATVKMRQPDGEWGDPVPIVHDTPVVLAGADQQYAYNVMISVTDAVGSTSIYDATVPPAEFAWDFRNDRSALGRLAGGSKTFIVPDDWTTNINADRLDGYHASDLISLVGTDADKLDGYHASNAASSIPISNGTLNTNLNADMLDGYHASDFLVYHHGIVSLSDYGASGDGVSVDNTAIADAISSTPVGGTLIFDARKVYLISLALSITKPMTIDLNGSTLKCDASSTSEIYAFVVASDNVTIKNGIIDMNMSFEGGVFSSGYNDLTFKYLTFKNLATTAGGSESTNPIPYRSSGNSIFLIGSDNIIIDRCNFFNCWNSDSPSITESNPFKGGGIVMWSSRHAWLTKLYFNHTGGGINLSKSSDFYIDNVHMYDIHDNGYYIQDDLYQVYSTNPETIHNIHLSNISIKGANEGIAFSVCRNYPENGKLSNFKVTNAHFENCDYAFYIRKGSGFQAENVSVVDCGHTMRVGGLYRYNSGAGPDYYRCTDISFDGLNVSNALKVSASGTGGAEIRVIRSDRIKILNSVQMGAYATTNDYHGIRLTYCDDCLMCNNRIIGPASGTVLTRGVSIDTCTDCTIMNPKVTGAATKVYQAGGSGNVIENWWA